MKNLCKLLCISIACALLITIFAGCGGGGNPSSGTAAPQPAASPEATPPPAAETNFPMDGPDINIMLAYSGTNETTSGKSALRFKSLLEEATGGKITVTTYDNNQLGSETETIEGVQAGNITMSIVATSPQVPFIPELAVFDLPNALTDLDAAYKVLSGGGFREQINAAYEKAGLRLIGVTPTAFRQMTSNKPVRSFEEFSGIRIRTMENKYHMAYWNALGASPTPLAFNELYMGLQQGLVDAQENPLNSIISTKLYEQQKYVIKTDHIMFIYCYFMNKGFYDGLSAEYQQAIDQAITQTTSEVLAESKQSELDAEAELKASGLEVIEVSADMRAKMIEAAQESYQMVRSDIGDALVDALLNDMETAK